MSADNRPAEVAGASPLAIVAVMAPAVGGTTSVTLLSVGYLLRVLDPDPAIAKIAVNGGWILAGSTALTLLLSAVILVLIALRESPVAEDGPETSPARDTLGGRTSLRTVDLASFVAGDRRAYLREEWSAVLAGDPENGIVLTSRRRMRYGIGFLWAALRMRLSDLASPLWMPVDWLLSKEARTHGFTALAVGAQILYIQHEDGVHALVTEGWGWCAGCGVALRLLVSWLRRVRGIELAPARGEPRDQ
ncbi:hypothetical protein [Streptomyces sp. NPDC047803]|uniref:hypothetical protein n=1 Tax=unclassified Streptomyces TaxID=2593676 RepID=UPI0033CE904B